VSGTGNNILPAWEQADKTAAKAVLRRRELLGGDQLPSAIDFGKTKCAEEG